MMARLVVFLISLTTVGLLSADYYLVEPTGEVYPVEKTQKGYEPISDASSFSVSLSPGYIDTVWYFDPDITGWYFPNRDSNTVVIQLFQYEYACSLTAVGINYYSPGWAEFYIWEGPDTVPNDTAEMRDYIDATWHYDSASNTWVSWPKVLYGPDSIGSDEPSDGQRRFCWVDLDPKLNIGTNFVWVGYKIIDHYNPDGTPYGGKPWPLCDGWVDYYGEPPRFPECRSWMMAVHPYYGYVRWMPYGNILGDWEMKYVIDIYFLPHLYIDRWPDTYSTAARRVRAWASFWCRYAELDSVSLTYWINSGDTTMVPMLPIPESSWVYYAYLPSLVVWDTVTYFASGKYYNYWLQSEIHRYVVREGTPGNILLLLEDDAYYGGSYSPDPVNAVAARVDLWDESLYGRADSSVLYYYYPRKGPGQPIIFWFTWGGFHFAKATDFLGDFLDAGGKLFLSSQDLPCGGFGLSSDYEDWLAPEGHFLHDYMKAYAGYDDWNTDTTFTQYGVPGDPISGSANLSEIMVYPYMWGGPGRNYAGKFDELDPACSPILYGTLGAVMGYRYEDTTGYRIVFIYWPCNYIVLPDLSGCDNDVQDTLIARTLDWFGYKTGIEEKERPRGSFFISQSAPNPFLDRTFIKYQLPQKGVVHIVIYNLLGQEIKTLCDEEQDSGLHTIIWDGKDNSGRRVPSGLYFLRLQALPSPGTREYTATRKLSVIR